MSRSKSRRRASQAARQSLDRNKPVSTIVSATGEEGDSQIATVIPIRPSKLPSSTKQERCLQIAQSRFEVRRTSGGRPYVLHGERRYYFARAELASIRADLRAAWREKYPEEPPPADTALNAVIEDLKHQAHNAEPDEVAAQLGEDAGSGDDLEEDDSGGIELVTSLDDCPLPGGYRVPDGWALSESGIWYAHPRWGVIRASWAWVFPVQVFIDPDGNQWIELAWRENGHWISRLVRKAISKSGRKLVAEYGDAGLPVTDSESREIEKWLAAAEMVNRAVIGRHPVARQLGWQKDGKTFVTGQDTPWRVEPRYADQAGALAAHHAGGTLRGWQKAISNADRHPVVQLGVYCGLAAPLLEVLGLDSFTVDIAGKSSRGKTITAMVALSCWANPSDKSDGMLSWQTTVIQAEKRFNLVNGLPVVLDETRLVKDPELIDTILYEVPKNHGKPRGGGWPNMIPWRTIVISTGEKPATAHTSHQGASPRVLSVLKPPFGVEGDASRADAEAVKSGIEQNYGTAGPAFVSELQKLLAAPSGTEDLRRRHAEMTSKLRGATDMSGRRAPLIAAIALAAEYAEKWKITPFKAPLPAKWLELFSAADDPRDNRPEMALDIVREYVSSHQDKMYSPGVGEHAPASGWIGQQQPEGPALLPEKLREELARRGYDLDAVLPGWLEMGALVLKGTRFPHLVNRRLGGRQARHLIFREEIIDPPEQVDPS